ncbi:MAG: Bax inhibitor-1/YccA family protein [Bacteroidetes bacterium]|nr:Bax inhibitor-1/YccA family protein [Bacteroidota bacterium]
METNYRNTNIDRFQTSQVVNTRTLLASVFTWMFIALGITTLISVLFANVEGLGNILFSEHLNAAGNLVKSPNALFWICLFAPLGLVMVINFAMEKLSFAVLLGLFFLYAAVNGVTFSVIIMSYTAASVAKVFASTCALFGVMAIAGYTTKADLTKMGSLLFIGLIGIIIATIINMFGQWSTLSLIISILGVIIFTGLTAYDVQKIKEMSTYSDGSAMYQKLGVRGALTLYLDFINIFLYLLRLFGKRD